MPTGAASQAGLHLPGRSPAQKQQCISTGFCAEQGLRVAHGGSAPARGCKNKLHGAVAPLLRSEAVGCGKGEEEQAGGGGKAEGAIRRKPGQPRGRSGRKRCDAAHTSCRPPPAPTLHDGGRSRRAAPRMRYPDTSSKNLRFFPRFPRFAVDSGATAPVYAAP